MMGFNWLLPQCFDLSCFSSIQCVGTHISIYALSKQLDAWNIYWAITYCPGKTIAWGITTINISGRPFQLAIAWKDTC